MRPAHHLQLGAPPPRDGGRDLEAENDRFEWLHYEAYVLFGSLGAHDLNRAFFVLLRNERIRPPYRLNGPASSVDHFEQFDRHIVQLTFDRLVETNRHRVWIPNLKNARSLLACTDNAVLEPSEIRAEGHATVADILAAYLIATPLT